MASEHVAYEDDDEDSFNNAEDDAGQMSDDSFNDGPVGDGDEEDGGGGGEEEEEKGQAFAHTTRKASSGAGVGSGASSGQSQLAFEVNSAKQGDYVILDESQLRASMDKLTNDVATVLHVPVHLASMLLRTHNWNKEKFETSYFEDPDRLLVKCGLQYMAEDGKQGAASTTARDERDISQSSSRSSLPSSTSLDRSKTAPASHSSSGSDSASSSSSSALSSAAAASSSAAAPAYNCPVCYDDFPLDATVALGCGHRFCHGCWSNYLLTAVNDGKLCIVSKCAGFKCPILVPDKTFKNLAPPDVFARHQNYLVRSFVEDSRLMRWCPGQRCNLAVRSFNSSLLAVKCRCGYAFCFQCGEENHAPVGCERLLEWNEKCKNESETAHWIMANCFPAADHQLMTAHGFMFLSDVLAHFEQHDELEVACSVDGQLLYRSITKDALTMHTGKHRHINMEAEGKLSLCPTDNHRMLARVSSNGQRGRKAAPSEGLRIHSAGAIFEAGQSEPTTTAQFVASCERGTPGSSAALPFISALALSSEDQCAAFLELYGYWLRNGRTDGATIALDARNQADAEYLETLFARLSLPILQSSGSYLICSPQWCAYFAAQIASSAADSGHCSDAQCLWSWVLQQCSREQLRLILRGLQHDASNGSISTSSLRFRDELQRLMLHAGFTSVFEEEESIHLSRVWSVRYTDHVAESCPSLLVSKQCHAVESVGTVWCVTVPTKEQLIFFRRVAATEQQEDGRVVVTAASRPIVVGNTKKCPNSKCGVRIEKNQGCNHVSHLFNIKYMTCRGCKFEWCWVCHGDWKLHGNHTGGYYKCNVWDPKAHQKADGGSAESAKEQLNRYLHYYQRFHNHDASKKFAEKQKALTDSRMQSLHAKSGGDAAWIDFQFLAAATQQVLECRNVLKYTYVFAYYLEDGPEKTLFEYLQQQLESTTEHLSELSELPPLDKLDRAQIVNYTRITGQFMQNLLTGVQTGLTPH